MMCSCVWVFHTACSHQCAK